MTRASMIVEHWRRLDGAVHPDDRPIFESHPHSFNLDFPPPAYLGDIENAPFVVLMMNGGYDASDTPMEFSGAGAVDAYLDRLHNPRPADLETLAPYYARPNYAQHLVRARLALVNAIAYRSGKLSEEPENKHLAQRLPSTLLHIQWLRDELLPSATERERVIIAHRNGMWNLRHNDREHSNMIVTGSGASPHLPRYVLDRLEGV